MPPYTSPILRLRLSALGEDLSSWGDPNLNNAFYRIEEALGSILTLTITGDRTLTSDNFVANEYRRAVHVLAAGGGLTAAFAITVPPISFVYTVTNTTTFPATYKMASGTGAVVRPGATSRVLCDGTNCRVIDPTLDQIKTAAGPVNFGGNKQTNVASGSDPTDGVNLGQVTGLVQPFATAASNSANSAASSASVAQQWASSTTIVSGGFKGAYGYAQDASASATVAQQWAATTGSQVAGTDYSAKEYAVGTTVPAGSAKAWATSTAAVSGGLKGALGYAQDASGSATSAANSATTAQAAVGSVKVTANDTTASVLASALVAGTNVSLTVTNPGGDEKLTIASSASSAPPVVSPVGIGARHFSPVSAGPITGVGANNTFLYALPIPIGRTLNYSGIAIFVDTGATGLARLGLYADSASGGPGIRIVDAGTVATDTAGEKIASITQSRPPGLYWLLLACNAAPTLRAHSPANPFIGSFSYTSTGYLTGLIRSFTFGALPADETAAVYNPTNGAFPVIALVPSS